MFRRLKASEIEARVAIVSAKGCSLLLYKDARCDMRILDETVGCLNWKRSHQSIDGNLYCTVELWDAEKQQWISKQDVGTESYTEKEKGQASDSFKRACFNLGIGRELYTAPFIWVTSGKVNLEQNSGKYTTKDRFSVDTIDYDKEGNITQLAIRNDTKNVLAFQMGEKVTEEQKDQAEFDKKADELIQPFHVIALKNKYSKPEVEKNIFDHFKISKWEEMTLTQMNELIAKGGK